MPLTLIAPRKGKTPFFYVRGSYLGERLNRSTKTDKRALAKQILRRWREQIERGEYRVVQEVGPEPGAPTFAQAVVSYIKAGGEGRFLNPALDTLGHLLVTEINQAAIDNAAAVAMPGKAAPYRNRNFYTPVSAVLKHAGIERKIRRPKGWRGKRSTSWLEPEEAFRIFKEADKINGEFGLFLRFLFYTGRRLSETLNITLGRVNLERSMVYLPETKNGEPCPVHLPPSLVTALANHPRGLDRASDDYLFRFHAGGRLRDMFNLAKRRARVSKPRRQGGFHIFCHTYGTLMRRYGQLDTFDLVQTGRWKDPESAARYAHTDVSETARKADLLPVERAWKKPRKKRIP